MKSAFSTKVSGTTASWALLLALLPMLTFMGHWPASIDVPGTDYYIGLPYVASHGHTHEAQSRGGNDHSQHCHGDSAGCSDVPAAAGASFGLMNESVALAIAGGVLIALAGLRRAAHSQNTPAPEPLPPRAVLSPV